MKEFNIMNIISIVFIVVLTIYVISIFRQRNAEKNRLKNINSNRLCYLFANQYINIISINGKLPVPLTRDEYSRFKKVPVKSKGYIFEYTNVLELKYQYSEFHPIKKNIRTEEMTSIYNVQPEKIYFIYGDDKDEEEILIKFEDIVKESN